MAIFDSISIPKTVGEALAHPGWRVVMIDEMHALEHNDTWSLDELVVDKKAIGWKWVFTIKVNPHGSGDHLKG